MVDHDDALLSTEEIETEHESREEDENKYPEESLNYQVIKYKHLYCLSFFLIGIFNNNGYVLV